MSDSNESSDAPDSDDESTPGADVTERDPDVVDEEGHGVTVEGGGDAGASSPEESEEVDETPPDEPDTHGPDEPREEAATDQENLDNHRDEEPFES